MKQSGGFAHVAAMTHQGARRVSNEDTVLVGRWLRSTPMDGPQSFVLPLDRPVLCMVADGMGGHAAGHEASRIACEYLSSVSDSIESEQQILDAVISADRSIAEAAMADPLMHGMGTTVAGVVMRRDGVWWFNVGDSAVFRYRNGFLRQISSDDIPFGEVPGRRSNRITQCLGGGISDVRLAPHSGYDLREPGSRYLICSDGLTDMLPMGAIEAELDLENPLETVSRLYRAAMVAGGNDNISIILVSWIEENLEEPNGEK